MGGGASQATESLAKSMTGTEASQDAADDVLYEAHREELMEVMKGGQARLQPRGEGGVGLLNQGATCYMNSLLQALFNIPEFRLAVYSFEHDEELHGEASRCIPAQLQKLFARLQFSCASACSTKELTAACGFSGRDAMEQHDVQELCRVLFDALERSSSMLAEAIRDLYSGKMTNYTRCSEDRGQLYESKRSTSYMDLQVPIQDCKSLEEALKKMTEPTLLSGENQWLCEDLGEKVDALSGTSIDTVPKILCLQLLRFVFDLQLMRRKKLSDQLAIPLELDLSFWGATKYLLAAVCLHSGTAHGGHYHAFLKDRGVWKDANDSRVQILGPQQCENLFAGDLLYSSDAYFLLYRRSDMAMPELQDVDVPPRLRGDVDVENRRLQLLQKVYVLHRRLTQVKVYPAGCDLLRPFVAQQLRGLVDQEPANDAHVAFSTLDPRPEKILEQALKRFAAGTWSQSLDLKAESAQLRHFDAQRGLVGPVLREAKPCLELIVDEGGPIPRQLEAVEGEAIFVVWWDAAKLDTEQVLALAFSRAQEPRAEEAAEAEVEDLFASKPAASASSVSLSELRAAIAKTWNLPVNSFAMVALTGVQAGQELTEDASLRECGLAPNDVICAEPRRARRAQQLYEEMMNTAQIFFNHPDRPDVTEELPVALSKDASLGELKAQVAKRLNLEKSELHLAKSQHVPAMFKDETRSIRQALGGADSVFVGHGAPCDPEESMIKVSRYLYENGNHKVSDAFNFPARGDMSVRSLKESLVKVLELRWNVEVTWKRLRLRDGQAGKHFAVLRDQRTLRSALLGFADGRQVAVQIMAEEEELGPDDMIILVRPWRVVEARLHAATEVVISRSRRLAEFQEKLQERFKGLLQDDKENQPEDVEDSLEICAAPVTGPPLTVKRCENLKWSESRLTDDKPLAECKELRDGVTVVVRSSLAARQAAKEPRAEGEGKGGGKGPGKAPKPQPQAPRVRELVAVPAVKEKGLVIKVAHPEAD